MQDVHADLESTLHLSQKNRFKKPPVLYPHPSRSDMNRENWSSTLSITSLITGGMSILLLSFLSMFFAIASLILAIIGMIVGSASLKLKNDNPLAGWAIGVSAVSFVLSLFFTFWGGVYYLSTLH